MIGGHRFLVSPLTILEIVRASVSSRCTRLSASVERRARGFQRLPRGDVRGFAGLRGGFEARQRLLRGLDRRRSSASRSPRPPVSCGELLLVRRDVGDLLVEPGEPVAMGADAGFELVALGGEVGERGGQFGELLLGLGQRRLGFGDALVDAGALLDARLDLFLQLGVFGVEPLQRDVGVRRSAAARGRCRLRTASGGGRVRRRAPWRALPRGRAARGHWSGAAARPRRGLRHRAAPAVRRRGSPGCARPRPARGCARPSRGR